MTERPPDLVLDPGRDVVGTPDPRPPRLVLGRRARGAGVLLAVVVAVGVVADRAEGRREVDALVAGVSAGERASVYADRRLTGTVEYTSGLLTSPDAAVRDSLRGLVQQEAAGQVPAVRAARAQVAHVRVLPWHAGQRRARAAELRLLDARVVRLQEVAASVDRLYERRAEPGASQRAARDALAPLLDPALLDRVLPAG